MKTIRWMTTDLIPDVEWRKICHPFLAALSVPLNRKGWYYVGYYPDHDRENICGPCKTPFVNRECAFYWSNEAALYPWLCLECASAWALELGADLPPVPPRWIVEC
jgi:hypothetical protein